MEDYLQQDEALGRIANMIAGLSSAEDIKRLLQELLTDAELYDIVLRWRLLELLTQKCPQRKIAELLRVSLCKITRGSRILKNPSSVCATLLFSQQAVGFTPIRQDNKT